MLIVCDDFERVYNMDNISFISADRNGADNYLSFNFDSTETVDVEHYATLDDVKTLAREIVDAYANGKKVFVID